MTTVAVAWHNAEKTILIERFDAAWAVADYRAAVDDEWRVLDAHAAPVDVIVDARRAIHPPQHFVSAGLYAVRNRSPHVRHIVIVAPHPVHRHMFAFVTSTVPGLSLSTHFARTPGDALALLTTLRRGGVTA